jgi:lysophospholipase L1-like esterase
VSKLSIKKIFFLSVLYLPGILFVSLIIYLSFYFSQLHHIDPIISINHYVKSQTTKSFHPLPQHEELIKSINEKTIVILGGSSVVLPDGCRSSNSDKINFPALLNIEFNKKSAHVVNLGQCGYDSFHLLGLAKLISKQKIQPKGIIIYSGHNDFSNGGRVILNQYSPLKYFTYPSIFSRLGIFKEFNYRANNFIGNFIIPFFLNIYKLSRPDILNSHEFKAIDKIIAEAFYMNINKISKLFVDQGLKVALVPAVGNLLFPPFTKDKDILQKFKQFTKENNILGLQTISDADNWGHDRRVKSILYKKTYPLLKEVLFIDVFGPIVKINDSQIFEAFFIDIFHLSKKGHEFFSKIILEDLQRSNFY